MKKLTLVFFVMLLMGTLSTTAQFFIPDFGPFIYDPPFNNITFIYDPDQPVVPPAQPVNPIPSNPTTTMPSHTNNSQTSNGHKCRVCNGTGEVISEVWMGSAHEKWCDKCKKSVYATHTHKLCTTCNGTGWITY